MLIYADIVLQKEQTKVDGSPGDSDRTSSTAKNSEVEPAKDSLSNTDRAAHLRKILLESRKLGPKAEASSNLMKSASEEPEKSSSEKVSAERQEQSESPGAFAKGSALDLEDLLAEGRAAAEAKAALQDKSVDKRSSNEFRPNAGGQELPRNGTPVLSKEKSDGNNKNIQENVKKWPLEALTKQDSPEQGEILEDEAIDKNRKIENRNIPVQSEGRVRKPESYNRPPLKDTRKPSLTDNTHQNPKSRSPLPAPRHDFHGVSRPISPIGEEQDSHKTVELTSFFSHYFDDVREWLELTGYHDQNYRKRALHRYRVLQVSEKEALKGQEDETHIMRIITFSLPQPTYNSRQTSGTKRAYSPDRGRQSTSSIAKLPRIDQDRYRASNMQQQFSSQRSSSVDGGPTSRNQDHSSSTSHQYRNRTRYFNRDLSPSTAHPPQHSNFYNSDVFEPLESRISGRDQASDRSYDLDRRHTDANIQFSRPDYGYASSYSRDYEDMDHHDYYNYQGRGRGRGRGRGYYNRGTYNDGSGASRGRGRGRGAPGAAYADGSSLPAKPSV